MTDQWGRRLFTAGGIFLLLLGCVHAMSLLGKPIPANDTERQLFTLASNYKLNVMGSMRSYDNFLRGFSISFMLAALVMGALALVLRHERVGVLKKVALVNSIWLVLMIVVSFRYFFLLPTAFLVTALVIFLLAWVKLPFVPRQT